MPKRRLGAAKGCGSQEMYSVMGSLGVQPAGKVFLYAVKPRVPSHKDEDWETDRQKLISELSNSILPHLEQLKKIALDAENGACKGLQIKVVFVLGKQEQEKDIDNMQKWFLDCLKVAAQIDDSHIVDLRSIKHRLSGDRPGFIGLTIGSVAYDKGDLATAQLLALTNGQAEFRKKKKNYQSLDDLKEVAEMVMKMMEGRVKPNLT